MKQRKRAGTFIGGDAAELEALEREAARRAAAEEAGEEEEAGEREEEEEEEEQEEEKDEGGDENGGGEAKGGKEGFQRERRVSSVDAKFLNSLRRNRNVAEQTKDSSSTSEWHRAVFASQTMRETRAQCRTIGSKVICLGSKDD